LADSLLARVRLGQRLPVGAVGGHRVVGVADEDDPRAERNLFAGEALGIAAPVEALVLVAHERQDVAQELDRGQDALAHDGVALDDGPLLVGEGAVLVEDRLGDRDLADDGELVPAVARSCCRGASFRAASRRPA
jgi:hypothetical protein